MNPETEKNITPLVQLVVFRLKTYPAFKPDDRNDLSQELWLHLLTRVKHSRLSLDNKPGLVRRILWNKGTDMIRARHSGKGLFSHANMLSLDYVVEMDDMGNPIILAETISDGGMPVGEKVASKLDCTEKLASLPSSLNRVVDMLLGGETHAAIADQAGMSLTTFRRNCLDMIRAVFSEQQ